MDGMLMQLRSLKENRSKKHTYAKTQEETAEISTTYNKERRLGEFDTPKTYRRQNEEGKAEGIYLTNLYAWMAERGLEVL